MLHGIDTLSIFDGRCVSVCVSCTLGTLGHAGTRICTPVGRGSFIKFISPTRHNYTYTIYLEISFQNAACALVWRRISDVPNMR